MAWMRSLAATMILVLGTAGAARADEAAWTPLIEPAGLVALMEQEEPVILDIRSVKDYAGGHLENAISVPYHAWRGPETNPGALIDDEKLTFLLQEAGIERDSAVIVSHAGRTTLDFGAAARVYWTLKSAGLTRIAILNGGLQGWTAAGEALTTAEGANFPTEETYALAADWQADESEVAAIEAGRGDAILVDARPDSFFRGEERHELVALKGALSGALNLPHGAWFTGDTGTMTADPAAIRARAEAAGWTPGTRIVSYCNTGHWAATNWFALSEVAGIGNVALWPESLAGRDARGTGPRAEASPAN